MIRINLAKKIKRKSAAPKIIFWILILAAVAGAGYHYGPTYVPPIIELAQSEIRARQTTTPRTPLPAPIPRSDEPEVLPSTKVRSAMTENVVRDVVEDDNRTQSLLAVPYADMSLAEKINYEVLYGRNAFDMVARAVPPGIRLRSLAIDSFQIVHANGVGISREIVREMFSMFQAERGELLPPPRSQIRDGSSGSYVFDIRHRTNFGVGISEVFQAIDHLGFAESVPAHLRTFSRLAGEHGFRLSGNPVRQSANRIGEGEGIRYRRIVYRVSGTTSFGELHGFIRALYDEKIPVAIARVAMVAVSEEVVRADIELWFTVRE